MPQNDWENIYTELERATVGWTREELVGLLRDLIREYVIERGLPTGTPAQAATPDLSAFDFPGLVSWLKRSLTLPELQLFSVDGRRVLVEADGGPREIRAAGGPRVPAPPPPLAPAEPAAPASTGPRREQAPARPQPPAATAPAEPAAAQQPPVSKRFRHLEFD